MGFTRESLEARAGIEPAHKGFADLSLTTWVPRLGRAAFKIIVEIRVQTAVANPDLPEGGLERETRFELATLALARRCSTTELLPLVRKFEYTGGTKGGQTAGLCRLAAPEVISCGDDPGFSLIICPSRMCRIRPATSAASGL